MRSNTLRLIIACIWCWATLIPLRVDAIPSWIFTGNNSTSTLEYSASTAGFDGSTTYIRRDNLTMTGIADSKTATISFWMNCQGGDGTSMRILDMGQQSTYVAVVVRSSGNKIYVECRSTPGGTVRIAMTGSTSITASSGWKHIFIVVNVAGAVDANNKIYIDGVAETMTYNTSASDVAIDWAASVPRWTIGANGTLSSPGNKFNGYLADFYFWNTAHDIPEEFISGDKPVDLGAAGNGSTAGTPDIYLSSNGSGNSWGADSSGNGNDFTVTGTLSSPAAP